MWRVVCLLVVVCFVCLVGVSAQDNFRVNESQSKAYFAGGRLQTELSVENRGPRFTGSILVEVLDTDDKVLARDQQTAEIKQGRQTIQVAPEMNAADDSDLLWYRLRYTIRSETGSEISGIVSLSEIISGIFELRAEASKDVFAGMNYRVRIRAFHPVKNLPVAGVKIEAELSLDLETNSKDDKLKLRAEGTTDREGFTVVSFQVPADAKLEGDDGNLTIAGTKDGIIRKIDEDLNAVSAQYLAYLYTDKPIYQPTQTFYARALLLGPYTNPPASAGSTAGTSLNFIIEDEDDTVLYKETVKSSRFGIASISWKIPDDAKLGTYRVRVQNDKDDDIGLESFKVSRYDLPNFTVTAKPDKTYYLPNENAEVTVSADYLFGKPVTKGHVRVVQEKERTWDYANQKWKVEEEKAYEGEADAEGRFIADVDLSAVHKDLKENEWQRFEDVHFAAYFTDPSTNRTEQRRFDLRISKEAIHVYLIGLNSYDARNPKLPVRFYVSTFYADGTPATCSVEIRAKYKDDPDSQARTLLTLKTNSRGVGRAELYVPQPATNKPESYDLETAVQASDAAGRTGKTDESIKIKTDEKQIQISADKTIYRPGEPVDINVTSTQIEGTVFLDVLMGESVVESRMLKLTNGKASLKIPYRQHFKGVVKIGVYSDQDGPDDERRVIVDSLNVIYPAAQNLRLSMKSAQDTYRPNEEAKVSFSVTSADNKSAENALGVVVFDKAIEERARTDAQFGGSNTGIFDEFGGLLGLGRSFGGFTINNIDELDLSKDISADTQLAAAALLADGYYQPTFFNSSYYDSNAEKAFAKFFKLRLAPVEAALKNRGVQTSEHPTGEASLRKILMDAGIDFGGLRDPWDSPYQAVFSIENDQDIVQLRSVGVDKIFGTPDDLTILNLSFKYFVPVGSKIDRASMNFYTRTGGFIHDYSSLRDELKKENFDIDALRDRWGNPYKYEFGAEGRYFVLRVKSSGPDGRFEDERSDDFEVWKTLNDYFTADEGRIQAIFSHYTGEKKVFPQSEAEFKEILKRGGVNFESMRDGWNRPLRLSYSFYSRFADKAKTEMVSKYGEKPAEKTTVEPVTQVVALFRVLSDGPDGIADNADDVVLTTFSGVISEQSKNDPKPIKISPETTFTGSKGAIHGILRDPAGAVVPGVLVTAKNEQTNEEFTATSDENGNYIVKNVPPGRYTVKAEGHGFLTSEIQNVPVRAFTGTTLDLTLQVASAATMVEVTAGNSFSIDSTDTTVQSNISQQIIDSVPKGISFDSLLKTGKKNGVTGAVDEQNSTPRLREYFPETLLWQPEIVTDKNGKAELKFKLGDNITTWKVYAVASSLEGKIGLAEKEIKAFQPFFVDLEPPKILTLGDEINLPVQIRNYTDAEQKVTATMAQANWFSFLGEPAKQVEVEAGSTRNAIFGFRTIESVKGGKQRVTAVAEKDSDAIEKPVTVHPDGKEATETQSKLFREAGSFDLNFPADTLPKTQRAHVKIYPNLMSHVAESVNGLLERPYGCGEQTISSTYPNLMILKIGKNSPVPAEIQKKAQKFLQQGYERLLSYRTSDGGFSFWTKDPADVALTAYAVRFLTDAEGFIDVDADVVKDAKKWLLAQQRADGSWTKLYSWEKTEDKGRTKLITTYVVRTLAMTERERKDKSADVRASMTRAFDYLKVRNAEIDEPYALANLALALGDFGDTAGAKTVTDKLRSMAITEGGGVYWNLETNTPFYGWGTAGRIETTALVVQALARSGDEADKDLTTKGTLFLLKNKDHYGVWYSTQATINVLDALISQLASESAAAGAALTAEVFVNGQKVKDVALPPANTLTFPIDVDLSDVINGPNNKVEIKIPGNTSATMAQSVTSYYIPWADFLADGRDTNQSRQLRLDYKCDKQSAKIAEEISCTVEAERIGFRGYGMLLAEIGLPPGAEVDRASLEKAKEDTWSFSRYDILPDRIITYMWAEPGGTKISFKFKPRYAINAQTAPSTVYDYYNEEARATLAPMRFVVK
jgi:A-macroglobulin TED domain/Alpha-2-macroglobulin family/Carboxypeptidase regulatory-like domain/MG2 domain/A-macroglobulin receptor binding domain/Macroglobulin domain MG3/Alpha-2-macroglobulin bait region domain